MTHITIPDTEPSVQYTVGGSSTTDFAIPFPFFALTDLVVYVGDELQTYGVDYTVAGTSGYTSGYPGGTVTLAVGVTSTTVTLYRNLTVARTSDFPPSGPFLIEVLNTDLDRLTAYIQELRARALLQAHGTDDWDAEGERITDVGTPVDGTDAVTKDYVESLVSADTGYLVSNSFLGDGSDTTFTLTVPVLGGSPAVVVAIDGAVQPPSTYDLEDTTLTFSEAPPYNSVIDVRVIGSAAAVIAATTLDALADVVIGTPTDGQVLTYDDGTETWGPEDPATVDLSSYATTSALTTGLATKANTSHTHAIADTTGLQAALDGKALASHTHAIADTTGLQAALDAKAASSHTHALDDLSDVTITAAATGHGLSYNGTAWVNGTQPYDLSVTLTGTLSNGEVVLRFVAPRSISFAANFTGSYAKAATASTGTAVLDLAKNGSGIGTITFTAGTTGVFASSGGSAQSLAAGDVLTLTGPATADTTLANVGITLAGTRA